MKNWPAPTETPLAPPRRRQRGGNAVITAATATMGLLALSLFSGTHLIFALISVPLVVIMAWTNPEGMIGILPIWMVLMGLIRRITPGGGNVTFSGDPVLIIGPIALLVLWALVSSKREPGEMTRLAKCVLAFNVIAFVEAFNPAQGSLLTGVGGLLFVLIPTAAFWIGRRYSDPEFIIRIIWTVAIMGLVAALYGLYQQFSGFPSWDSRWIQTKGYTALNVGGGVVRPFSVFSSAEEYAVFLSITAVAWVALLGKKTRWPMWIHVAALATVLVALYYEAQRTSFFLVVLAIGVMGASRLGLRPINVMAAGAISVVLLIAFAGALGGGASTGSSALKGTPSTSQILSSRQSSGLSNPLGAGSTLPGHISATKKGIEEGFHDPFGHGTGSVNEAATRFTTNNKLHGTEFDPGNMGIAFGLPGLIVYALVMIYALQMAYRLAVRRRDVIGLFVIGICAATLFQWTNGDLYSVCWLVWLAIGFGDRLIREPDAVVAEPVVVEAEGANERSWRRPGEPQRQLGNR